MALPRLLVIVPCLNEEESLPGLLDQLETARDALRPKANIDILVVDDGSVDRTSAIARSRGVRVARLCRNLGIGGAVQTGLRLAARGGYEWALQIDGDGQHPPSELEKLIDAAQGEPPPDLIIGSRFIEKEGFQSTRLRRMGISWLSFLLRCSVGLRVVDPTSGFRLFGKRALALFDEVYPYDYPEPESLAIARAASLRIKEVPVQMQERQGGRSSIFGLKAGYYMVKVTIAVLLTIGRNAHPWRSQR